MVKKIIWMILFTSFLYSPLQTNFPCAQDYIGVNRVEDGDTIVLYDGRKVRYSGINAPEVAHQDRKAEPCGDKAKYFNKNLVLLNKIRIETDKKKVDHFGRLLAYVYLTDNTFVNLKILEAGLAYYYPHSTNHRYSDMFLKAQRAAMMERKGIWKRLDQNGAPVIGNKKSRRFHVKTCKYGKRIKKTNRIALLNKWKAFWEGYAPCKECQDSDP